MTSEISNAYFRTPPVRARRITGNEHEAVSADTKTPRHLRSRQVVGATVRVRRRRAGGDLEAVVPP